MVFGRACRIRIGRRSVGGNLAGGWEMPNLPPSWKREIQETIEERANADREHWKAKQNDATTQITTAIESISDAQRTQTAHEDKHEKINVALAVITIGLVFLTVIFTCLSWLAFRDQLEEMRKVYGPIKTQADAANVSNRAWIAPRFVMINGPVKDGRPINIRIIFEDAGKTPALDVALKIETRTITMTDGSVVPVERYTNAEVGQNTSCNGKITSRNGVVYPQSNITGYINDFDVGTTETITAVKARTLVLAVQGCYEYTTLASRHQSIFCYYLEPAADKPIEQWQFKHCADGQDAN
jgi:hypothetical protein